ncbi:MAG: hypothetical protein K6G79_02305 [Bacteroidales bacterium]|nr:hypothetical protein [Bacteroidales bacterium]
MGITDRELEDYVSSISKKGVPLTRSKLLGHWVFTTGDHTNEYDFQSNHSYSYVNDYSSSYFKGMNWSGRMKMTVSYRGKWAFEGDSLVLTPDYNTVEMTVDPSGMVAEENMQDSLDSWVKNYRESTLNYFKDMVDKGDKYTVKALIDSAKDKMEWTDSDGNVRYVKRKEE